MVDGKTLLFKVVRHLSVTIVGILIRLCGFDLCQYLPIVYYLVSFQCIITLLPNSVFMLLWTIIEMMSGKLCDS